MDNEELLLDLLWELEEVLLLRSGSSLVEKYHYFNTNSEHGRDCSYAKRAKGLFYKNQFEKVRAKVLEINQLLAKLDEER